MPAGRPTVMTDSVVGKLEAAFLVGCTDTEACKIAQIARSTLYDYEEKNPEFTYRKSELRTNVIYAARKSVFQSMQTDGNLAFKFLERKVPEEFGTKKETDDNDKKDPNIKVIYV